MNFTIRRAEPGDYEAVARVFAGPKVASGTLQIPFPSADLWRKRLAEPAEGTVSLVACADNEIIGELGLHGNPLTPRRRHVASIGMAVRDDWQGKGAGAALMQAALDLADNWLNITRVELDVYVENEPAVRLYQKFGFEIEGTARQFAFRNGRYVDAYFMARLRPAPTAATS